MSGDEIAVALTDAEREALRAQLESWFGDPRQAFLVSEIAPVVAHVKADAVAAALAPVERLADEWAEEGASLVRNAYSGGDVVEGQTLERCARNLAALAEGKGGER